MSLLPVQLHHLERLTDDTGLLEHACGLVPNRKEGYSTDDNARALWVTAAWLPYASEGSQDRLRLLRLSETYLAFVNWVQEEDGHFYNDIAYDRRRQPENPSDDCFGRSLWACVEATVNLDPDRSLTAFTIIRSALTYLPHLHHLRGQAYAMAAIHRILIGAETGNETFQELVAAYGLWQHAQEFEARLSSAFTASRKPDWEWFEDRLTYGNGVLPWAMYWAYTTGGRRRTLEIAHTSLDFLVTQMTGPGGCIRPVGNLGWATRESRAQWDQQPLDVMKLALAAAKAWEVEKDPRWQEVVDRCHSWFHGDNDLGLSLVNVQEGSCCDGLQPDGRNKNQGAESTLAYLLTAHIHHQLELDVRSQTQARSVPSRRISAQLYGGDYRL